MRLMNRVKLWLSIAGAVTIAGFLALFIFGLKPGIDFTGGSFMEVAYGSAAERQSAADIKRQLEPLQLGNISVQLVDERGIQLRFKEVSEEEHQNILKALRGESATSTAVVATKKTQPNSAAAPIAVDELHFETVGPSIGQELRQKAASAIIICLIVIVAYVAWSFRRVSKPVASWKYGVASVIALFHDIMLVVGVFAVLGRYFNIEIDSSFIAALLTVLGYSVNDTIVVLDRVRENLPRSNEDFAGTVNTSINQTLARSINTTLTTVLALLALLFFGGESIHYFILALTIGIASGAYSSIFIAAPILVIWEKWQRRK